MNVPFHSNFYTVWHTDNIIMINETRICVLNCVENMCRKMLNGSIFSGGHLDSLIAYYILYLFKIVVLLFKTIFRNILLLFRVIGENPVNWRAFE